MISKSGRQPRINENAQVQAYYCGLESRIGYKLLLGATRHFGFYKRDTWWPFPVHKSLRAMEDKLAASLRLPSGSYVLDAGCGAGHVALHLATEHGLRVKGIDIQDGILLALASNESQVAVQKMDYHHLEGFAAETFDGVYTSETFVHATDPEAVLAGFFRILKPGGRLAMHEYDHDVPADSSRFVTHYALKINEFAGMPTNSLSHRGALQRMLEDAGFVDVTVQDYSENIKPMARLFYILALVPFFLVVLLGLERHFINTVGGFGAYYYRSYWRYLAITATKPGRSFEAARTK